GFVARFYNGPCGAARKTKRVGLRVKRAQPRIDQSLPQLPDLGRLARLHLGEDTRVGYGWRRNAACFRGAECRHGGSLCCWTSVVYALSRGSPRGWRGQQHRLGPGLFWNGRLRLSAAAAIVRTA